MKKILKLKNYGTRIDKKLSLDRHDENGDFVNQEAFFYKNYDEARPDALKLQAEGFELDSTLKAMLEIEA